MNKMLSKEEFEAKACRKPNIARWHVMAGICLLNGYREGVELGVSKGRFTTFLCGTIHDMHMTAVDLWMEQPGNKGECAETYVGWEHEESYQTFKGVCEKYFSERVKILRMDTTAAAEHVEDGSMDFVFIDADHSYEGCKRDIAAWLPKVRVGGMLCGHDYSYQWPTVKRAVDEMGWKITVASDHVWMYKKDE